MKGGLYIPHIVTCTICREKFDRDKFPCQQVSPKRYAHLACYQQQEAHKSQEDKDKEALEQYIMKLFGETYINARIRKQLNTYIEEYSFTYSGILKALIYFYEIKKNSIDKSNGGIGIVPYIYKDAYNYYYSLWLAQQKNNNKVLLDYAPKVREVKIPVPERKIRKRNLFSFLDKEEVE